MSARRGSPDRPSTSRTPDRDLPVAISKPSRRDERYAKSDFVAQWDPQEGFMPQILALTASPKKENKKKRNYLLIGSNRECSSCGEAGDLVCCSRCNRCYHTLCHNPPLDDDNLPQSKWSCFNCTFSDNSPSPASLGEADEVPTGEGDPWRMSYAFKMLLKAVEHDNSEEFQLTKEVSLPYVFTGYGRPTKKRLKAMKSARLEQGMVPMPVRTCFTCDKSARNGPLIHCDYCPLMFHTDCLDPPLSMIPTARWMCPNHPNHLIDDKVSSERHTTRVKLWNEYCCNTITEQRTMYEFFHKNSRKDPPFNRKRMIPTENIKVAIPSHVKAMYRGGKRRREQGDWLNGIIAMNPRIIDFDSLTVDDLSETTVRLLATQMLESMRPEKKKQAEKIITVEPRAFITPGLGSSGPQILITDKCLVVGKSSAADLNLEYYGDCNYVSERHAIIFYDEVTDCFELLNYSEHGTYVDGVLYSNNIEHLVVHNRMSISPSKSQSAKEKKKLKEKRPPMKRGRKSKAEKAALEAAEKAAAAARNEVEEVDLTSWSDDNTLTKIKKEQPNENQDSEETLSVAGRSSTPAIPVSENSETPEMNGLANGHHEEEPMTPEENEVAGDIDGPPLPCICDQTNLIGRVLPSEGFEGNAMLHGGSVIKIGCIVLLFNRITQYL